MLRAVAVLFVVVAHFRVLFFWRDSWLDRIGALPFWGGVDLFFCISGFVITGTLLRNEGRVERFAHLGVPFWIRRVFRIWPAALLWLAIPLLCARFFNVSGAFGTVRGDVPGAAAAAGQVANFYQMICQAEPHARWPCGRADVYWSLSLEEQFYLVFPLLFFFLRRSVLRSVLVALVLAQIFILRPLASPLWLVRTDAIALGVLIALSSSRPLIAEHIPRWVRQGRVASLLSILLLATIALLCSRPFALTTGSLALVSAALVLIASANADVIMPWQPLRNVLLWVGSRSFAIYLAHMPCYWATREIFLRLPHHGAFKDGHTMPFALVAAVLLALAAEGTYRCVEAPLRNTGRKLAERFLVTRCDSRRISSLTAECQEFPRAG